MALGDRDRSNTLNWDLYVKGNKMALSVEVIDAGLEHFIRDPCMNHDSGQNLVYQSASTAPVGSENIIHVSNNYSDYASHISSYAFSLESGFLCPLAITINLIIVHARDLDFKQLIPVDLSPVIYQFAGIAPTLVITRARTGKSIESVDQTILSIHFAATHQDVEIPRGSTPHQLQQVSGSIRELPRGRDTATLISSTPENCQNLSVSEK
ncbi:hypothetical protein WG66_006123 [Moniliophthora roreri]|nr:hypothetical protein WG66_006123 [Moniliophthora roreri]